MRSIYLTCFASLLWGSYANVQPTPSALDPTITPAPAVPIELLRKQNDNRFMGWIQYNGEWTTRECDIGGTLYQSGDFWRCCATTVASCNIPVGCISGSLIYDFSTGTVTKGTYACTDIYTEPADASFTLCNTGFMFENTLDSDPQTNVFCGVSAVNWSYYRVDPETSSSSSATPSSSSSSPRSTSASVTGPTGASGASSSSTQSPTPQPKKESKAWIAGAVVGPVVGLALLGGLLFFCLRRRNKGKTSVPPPTGPAYTPAPTGPPSSYPGSPDQGYQQPYYPSMQQDPNAPGFVPYGVAGGAGPHEQKHQSLYAPAPVPHSPHSQGSTSPIPPTSPYMPPSQPHQPQQWEHVQQPNSPQMLGGEINHPQGGFQQSAPMSPPPQHAEVPKQTYDHRVVSSELDSTPWQPPVAQHEGAR